MTFEEIWQAHRKKVAGLAVRMAGGRGDSDLADELAAAGFVGLWRAFGQYDEPRGDFWQYAQFRVRGEMRDAAREMDPLSRLDRRRVRDGRPGAILVQPVGEEEAAHLPSGEDPEISLGSAEELSHLLGSLSKRSREVVLRVVLEDERLVDLARELGVTPSRVCQVVKGALHDLRRTMVYCEICKKKKLDGPEWCKACGGRLRHLRAGEVVEEHDSSPASRKRTCGKQSDVEAPVPSTAKDAEVARPAVARGRRPRLYDHGGESLTLRQWADKIGVRYRTLAAKIQRGGSLDEILSARLDRSEAPPDPAMAGESGEREVTIVEPSGEQEEPQARSNVKEAREELETLIRGRLHVVKVHATIAQAIDVLIAASRSEGARSLASRPRDPSRPEPRTLTDIEDQ